MSKWYRLVVSDLSKIAVCIDHFEIEAEEARKELTLRGKSLEKHGADLPGIVENRFSQLQEIEAILEYLNIEYRKRKSIAFKKFLETYNKALSSRDAEKYSEGDVDVVNMALLINEFALVRNKFIALTKGLDQKSWMLGHIVKLRAAGLDDAQID